MPITNPNLLRQYQNPLFQPVRAYQQPVQQLAPIEDEGSLLGQMGSSVLPGLSAVGNFFDLPGSSLRDLATGQDPTDQWFTPFSGDNRATGRDVLAHYNFATPNDPNRWELMDFVGGLAEIPMDPFFWAPAGSIARGASAAKSVIPKTVRTAVSNSAVGRAAESAGLLGNQLFRASVKGRATKQGQKSAQKLHADQLASDQSVLSELLPAARDLDDLEIETVGADGLASIVRGSDRSNLHRDYLEGVEGAAERLDPREMEILDRVQGYKESIRERLVKLGRNSGDLDDEINHVFRRMGRDVEGAFEKVKGNEPRSPLTSFNPGDTSREEYLKGFRGGTNQVNEVYSDPEFDRMIQQMADAGAKKKEIIQSVRDRLQEKYGDEIIPEYQVLSEKSGDPLYRVKVMDLDADGNPVKLFKTVGISKRQMEKYAKPIESGPNQGKMFYESVIKIGGKEKKRQMIIEAPVMKDRYQEIAKAIVKTPEFRTNGIFTNRLLEDAYDGLRGMRYQADAIDATYDLLSSDGVILGRMAPQVNLKPGERSVKLVDLLKELRVSMDTAMAEIAKRKYKIDDLNPATLKAMRKMEVDKAVADDLRALWTGFRAPAEVGPLTKGVNSLTSLFKAGVLTWPARYSRDLMSGMVRNWENGVFDLGSAKQAYRILQGETVEGLERIPEVQQWLQRTGREVNAENASKAVAEIYASMKASPTFMHTDVAVDAAAVAGRSGFAESAARRVDPDVQIVPDRAGMTANDATTAYFDVEVNGEKIGEWIVGKAGRGTTGTARRMFPDLVGETDNVARVHGIEIFDEANRGQGRGQMTYLKGMDAHGADWYYNSQTFEDASNTLRSLEDKGLIEIHWHGGRKPGFDEPGGVHLMRLTEKGRKVAKGESPLPRSSDNATAAAQSAANVPDMLLDQIPGRKPSLSARELGSTFFGRAPGTDLNPMNVRGNSFLNRADPGQVRADTTFGPAAAGDILGKFTDDMNRLVPLINQMKKGVPSSKAMELVQRLQVDYSPRSFTKFEQGLKQLQPFYSFSSRQIPYLTKELLNNPAGRLGQIIQATRRGRGEDDGSLPDYVAGTTAIPIGESPDGTKSFITGLGLMHEDPLSFFTFNKNSLAPNVMDALVEVGSRLNPVYKAPLELMAGESFFQRGPMGGRDLLDMDPTMGRLASNVSQWITGNPIEDAAGRAFPVGGVVGEHLIANSPVARLMSTARTITDPRKYEGDFPGLGVATNLLTGARVSDISPAAQESVERERIQAYGREFLGAKSYVATYIPKEVIEETRKTNPEEARKYEAFNRVRQIFKKRKEKREQGQQVQQQPVTTGGSNRLKQALLSR